MSGFIKRAGNLNGKIQRISTVYIEVRRKSRGQCFRHLISVGRRAVHAYIKYKSKTNIDIESENLITLCKTMKMKL